MTTKADFNAEEWSQVAEGPPLAGLIVIAAQRGGTLRESMQMAKYWVSEREQHEGGELLDALLAERPEVDPKQFKSAEALRSEGLEKVRAAVALLESKATPEEVEAYKRFTLGLAQRVAEAHKSGGVLGVGGEQVSAAESTALSEIAETLGLEPPTTTQEAS